MSLASASDYRSLLTPSSVTLPRLALTPPSTLPSIPLGLSARRARRMATRGPSSSAAASTSQVSLDASSLAGSMESTSASSRRPTRLRSRSSRSTLRSNLPPTPTSATKRTLQDSDDTDHVTSGEEMQVDGEERVKRIRRNAELPTPRTIRRRRREQPPLSLTGRFPAPRGFHADALSPLSPLRPTLTRNATAVTPPELTPPIPSRSDDRLFAMSSDEEDGDASPMARHRSPWLRAGYESSVDVEQAESSGDWMVRAAHERSERLQHLRDSLRSPSTLPLPPRPRTRSQGEPVDPYTTPPTVSEPVFAPGAPRRPNARSLFEPLSDDDEEPLPTLRRRNAPVAEQLPDRSVWGELTDAADSSNAHRPGALSQGRMRGPTRAMNEAWLRGERDAIAEEASARVLRTEDSLARLRAVIGNLRTGHAAPERPAGERSVAEDMARGRAARLAHMRAEAEALRVQARSQQPFDAQPRRFTDTDPFANLTAARREVLTRYPDEPAPLDAADSIREHFDFRAHAAALAHFYRSEPRLAHRPVGERREGEGPMPPTPGDPFFNPGLTRTINPPPPIPRRAGPWEWLSPPMLPRAFGVAMRDDGLGDSRSMMADPRNYMPDYEWDYDALSALTDRLGEVKRRTATADEVKNDKTLHAVTAAEVIRSGEPRCPICLCEYEEDASIRRLKCSHTYHQGCIEHWLTQGQNSCPTCRGPGVDMKDDSYTFQRHDGPLPMLFDAAY